MTRSAAIGGAAIIYSGVPTTASNEVVFVTGLSHVDSGQPVARSDHGFRCQIGGTDCFDLTRCRCCTAR